MRLTDSQREQVINFTRELVRARGLAGQERDAADVCERWMKKLGYDEVWVDRYGSVVGRRASASPSASGKTIHFDGHIDTVPATDLDKWQHEPYGGELSDGRIWGRGSSDMKGQVAAMICAGAWLARESFAGTIAVSASVGEEELEGAALEAILQEHRADVVIIGEATDLQVGIGQIGRAGIHIDTHGVPAHSSVPEEGVNAVYKMMEVIERLRKIEAPRDAVLTPGICELVEIISAPYPGTSIVPHGCRIRIDRRLIQNETPQSVMAGFRDAFDGIDDVDVRYMQVKLPCYTGETLEAEDFHAGWAIDKESDLVKSVEQALTTLDLPITYFTSRYTANGSASAGKMGIPTLLFGPSDPALLHTIDEYIGVEQLVRGTEAYMAISRAILKT